MTNQLVLWTLLVTVPPMPEPLQKFQRAREELSCASIASVITGGRRIVGMPVQRHSLVVARNGDFAQIYEGDPEGVLGRNEDGVPMQVGRRSALRRANESFVTNTWEPLGLLSPGCRHGKPLFGFSEFNFDLRAIGMTCDWDAFDNRPGNAVLANSLKDVETYESSREGDHCRVECRFKNGGALVFELDASRGWNATRITRREAGHEWDCQIDLKRYGSTWFPSHVVMQRDGEVRTEITVTNATFEPADVPVSIEPESIGFEVGLPVAIAKADSVAALPPPSDKGSLIWDGSKAVPYQEGMDLIQQGVIEPGPIRRALMAGTYEQPGLKLRDRLRLSPGVLEARISAWEAFVMQFNSRYRLESDQREAAWRCLRKAQDEARQVLRRQQSEVEGLRKLIESDTPQEQLRARFDRLAAPIHEIFEQRLKPCLESIPTRKQREAAKQPGQESASKRRSAP